MLYHNEIFVIVFSSKHLIVTYLEITKFKTATFCYSYTLTTKTEIEWLGYQKMYALMKIHIIDVKCKQRTFICLNKMYKSIH